jgi:hypothetical protein
MSGQHFPISWWLRLCRWLWKYPLPFLFSTLIINVAINIGSTWLITPATTKTIPDTSIVGNITGWVSAHWVFSLLLGTISVALLLVTWRGSREPESTSSVLNQAHMSTRHRERMLRRLRVRYEQVLAQSLQGVAEIELGLTSRPAAIHNAMSLSLRLPEQPEQALPAHTSILDAYNLAQQELLILGEPGAGKSTLLLELAQHLVDLAEQDAVQPLPVVLPLSSWATKRLPLQGWLIEQFALLYDVPHHLSHDWMQAELILPLLDGLDEMEESARPACIAAVNAYHRDHLQPLVVCSRTGEYNTAAQHERIALHTAIVVQPLTREQIDIHLATIGKPLTALRAALKKNTTLQTLVETPLLLQILILTYYNAPVHELSHKEAVQLQKQIWGDYVQRMVSRKGNRKRYPLELTCTKLSSLARYMRSHYETIFFPKQLVPGQLPRRQKAIYRFNIGLLFGPLFGIAWWVVFGGLINALVYALLTTLVFGLEEKKTSKDSGWEWKASLAFLLVALTFIWRAGLVLGLLSIALFIALCVGIAALRPSILHFWFSLSYRFPLRIVPFLEDASARILLRRNGKGYSFTHRLLLDYFADLDIGTPMPSPKLHPVPPSPSVP